MFSSWNLLSVLSFIILYTVLPSAVKGATLSLNSSLSVSLAELQPVLDMATTHVLAMPQLKPDGVLKEADTNAFGFHLCALRSSLPANHR